MRVVKWMTTSCKEWAILSLVDDCEAAVLFGAWNWARREAAAWKGCHWPCGCFHAHARTRAHTHTHTRIALSKLVGNNPLCWSSLHSEYITNHKWISCISFYTFNIMTKHFLCHVNIVKLSTTVVVHQALHIQSPHLLVQWLQDTLTTTSLARNTSAVNPLRPVLHFSTLLGTGSYKLSHLWRHIA